MFRFFHENMRIRPEDFNGYNYVVLAFLMHKMFAVRHTAFHSGRTTFGRPTCVSAKA